MAIRLVVCDVAGTTVQSGGGAVQRAMRAAIAAAGLELREGAMAGVTGMAKPQAIRTLLEGHGRTELIDRTDAIHADFVGVSVPDRYVFGFGMDVEGAWRNLPAIYAI